MLRQNFKNVFGLVKDYWRIYGGYEAVIYSPYFAMAAIFTLLSASYWTSSSSWTQDVIDIIPSILGFSLGGFAIFMAFSDEKFIEILVDKEDRLSFYMHLSAQFIHFILIQALSILFAVFSRGLLPAPNISDISFADMIISMLGYLIFSYAIFTAIATAFSLLRIGRLYHTFRTRGGDGATKRSE